MVPQIETERRLLRPLAESDLNEMATLLGDAEALVFWGGPLTREQARDWIGRNLARYENDG